MKLTQLSQALTVVLLGFLAYYGWETLQIHKGNSEKMEVITKYVDALAAQVEAQKKTQAESGTVGLVTPMTFESTASSAPTVSTAPVPVQPPAGIAGSAPSTPTLPGPAVPSVPVETPLMKVVKNAVAIGSVTSVDLQNGYVTLNAGAKNQVKEGQSFHLRRDASVVGLIKITLVEDAESAADLNLKSVPAGVSVKPGDEVIAMVNLNP